MQHHPLVSERTTDALRKLFQPMRGSQPIRVPAERELAERLCVSRVSLRKAMSVLVSEGLLMQKQGMGTYVLPAPAIAELCLYRSSDIRDDDPFYQALLSSVTRQAARMGTRLRPLDQPKCETASNESASKETTSFEIASDETASNATVETALDETSSNATVETASGERTSNETSSNTAVSGTDMETVEDGGPLLVIGPVPVEQAECLTRQHARIVSVHGGASLRDATMVRFDDRRIGREAAETLLNRGFRRLCLLAGPARFDSAQERKQGFLEIASGAGASVQILEGRMNWSGGILAAEQLLAEGTRKTLPEGVFAANDWMALGFMQRMRMEGILVPGDLSVVGCDDISLAGEFDPPLATFSFDLDALSSEIMACLMGGEKSAPGRSILLPAVFVARGSLGSLPTQR